MTVFQPLAVGDSWTYACQLRSTGGDKFTIENRVVGTVRSQGRTLYEFSLQIPSSPTKSVQQIQLLTNDAKGNAWLHGYLVAGKVRLVRKALFVPRAPVVNTSYNYPGPEGGIVSRIFEAFTVTNPTPLGTFTVAVFYETGATHNYGYHVGTGIMEEDHGPNFQYDCLIEKYVVK
jgi:hypothetical protein